MRAVDAAGNVDPTPATYTWSIVAPTCGTQTVGANADSWIEQSGPSSNKGTDSGLKVMSKSSNGNARALVRFPLPTTPAGCVLESATLRLYASSAAQGRTLQAIRLAAGWNETGVTWSNQPATTGAAATLVSGSGPGHREWNVTSQIGAGAANGFLIRDSVENNGGSEHQFNSREKSDNQPQLVYRFAAAAGSAPNCGSAQTLGASGDAWIDQASPIANKGNDSALRVLSKAPANNARALVRFSLPAIPAGCVVESATLRLYASAVVTERTLEADRVTGSWSEGGVTWSNQPATAGAPATTMSGVGPNPPLGYRTWDVDSQVLAMYGGPNEGFLIRDAGENYGGLEQVFKSSESASDRPELVITFAAPDTRAPKTTIDSGPPATGTSTSATFRFSSNESGSTFQCSLDGTPFVVCASPKDYTNVSFGNHTLRVRAIDRAGNADASPASYSWSTSAPPDLQPPDTSITQQPANPTSGRSPSFAFTGGDDSTPASMLTFECRLDNAAFASCTSPKG